MSKSKIIRKTRYSSAESARLKAAKEAARTARRARMKTREALKWLRRGAPIVPISEDQGRYAKAAFTQP